jgi:excisionase family DNA binding protein
MTMKMLVFTVHEVAKLARMSPGTVRNRIRSGVLPAWKDGRILRVRRDHLEQYVQRQLTDDELSPILASSGKTD